jgi:coproporphyrinogen dehydrogenase HemZ
LSPGRVLMLALYHGLQQAVGAYTPWGALTGIRPSKMVREWLTRGWSDDKIIATLADPFCCTRPKAELALTVAHAEDRLTARIYEQAASKPLTPPRHSGLTSTQFAANTYPAARHCGLDPQSPSASHLNNTKKRVASSNRLRIKSAMTVQCEVPPKPVGIYVSVPFCPTRCLYCSFNVDHNFASKDIYAQYVAAVARECKTQAARLREMGGVVSSVYIGGGTPTALPEPLLEQLLNAVAENFDTAVEYSVEAGRPDTLTKEKLAMLRRYGASRIAVNPQTLKDSTLQKTGRKHTAADFFTAFHLARDAGFDCINADLIVGLPGETVDDVHRTMEGVAALSPENITVHTLAVKRASRLNLLKGEYALPDAHTTEAMLAVAEKACQSAGLSPYYMYRQKNMVGMFENVGYAKPGYECLYNVGMMAETQTVLGIGAGAVSKFVTDGYITREFNVKNPEVYVARQGEHHIRP